MIEFCYFQTLNVLVSAKSKFALFHLYSITSKQQWRYDVTLSV